jgi:signal peptidase I
MTASNDFYDRIQKTTEDFLTRRRRLKRIKKEKQRQKNVIVDWIEAFLWAAGVVLLINQYLFQAYQIPSGSMIDTLRIGDRIFVNKLVYGPELLPGLGKLPSPIRPGRNDIIIFENPSYISRGPAFDIAQRIIYMLTLSFVDIDRDEKGEPKAHFLIKRATAMAGDRFTFDRGDMKIRFAGESEWTDESEYKTARGWNHRLSRLVTQDQYPALEAAGKASAYADLGILPPDEVLVQASAAERIRYPDYLTKERVRLETLRGIDPHDERYRAVLARSSMGRYVPEGRVLPLGDNRDNSQDGRYFGPVREAKILGKGAFIYWPWRRIRTIR